MHGHMTGREIREYLEQAQVMPSKQLGQNFLVDPNMAKWIVAQLDLHAHDAVCEVGPGTGALSSHLVGHVRKLILIEFDARLATALRERYRDEPTVEIHHADGAKWDRRLLFKHRPLKFLGNLPYSSGGAILKNLLTRPHPFDRAVIMLQKEVIERLAAEPGSKNYGILTLRMQAHWKIQPLRNVPPEAFFPRPTIDSSVALLMPRGDELPQVNDRYFDTLIRSGFAQRRKQLKKQLPKEANWSEIFQQLEISETTRAEQLSLRQWIELARAYDDHPLKSTPQSADESFDVVDAQDQVIGQATRREVHEKTLWHRAVHVLVFNAKGEVLLQKRSLTKDTCPGLWDSSVSGHLDAGENYADAARRELLEEMGIAHDGELQPLEKIAPCAETGWEFVALYQIFYDGKIRFPCAEIESTMWFPVAEINAWSAVNPQDFASGFLTCWRAWCNHRTQA